MVPGSYRGTFGAPSSECSKISRGTNGWPAAGWVRRAPPANPGWLTTSGMRSRSCSMAGMCGSLSSAPSRDSRGTNGARAAGDAESESVGGPRPPSNGSRCVSGRLSVSGPNWCTGPWSTERSGSRATNAVGGGSLSVGTWATWASLVRKPLAATRAVGRARGLREEEEEGAPPPPPPAVPPT